MYAGSLYADDEDVPANPFDPRPGVDFLDEKAEEEEEAEEEEALAGDAIPGPPPALAQNGSTSRTALRLLSCILYNYHINQTK